jgi:F-type H+-transporting ATPase subunit c
MLRKVSVGLALLTILALPAAALAQQGETPGAKPGVSAGGGFTLLTPQAAAYIAAGVGAGIVVIGGAKGIAHIGGSAVESMARQPEAAGSINAATIITAAMVEGATLFAVVVCLLLLLLK